MDLDDLKTRISFALKDPVLQQGFEIMCKRLDTVERLYNDMLENYIKCSNAFRDLQKYLDKYLGMKK